MNGEVQALLVRGVFSLAVGCEWFWAVGLTSSPVATELGRPQSAVENIVPDAHRLGLKSTSFLEN